MPTEEEPPAAAAAAAPPAKDECVKVVVRIRPLSRKEKQDGHQANTTANEKNGQIVVENPKGDEGEPPKTFTFDHVFSDTCTQKQVYEKTAAPAVDAALNGFNATVFVYGQVVNAPRESTPSSLIWRGCSLTDVSLPRPAPASRTRWRAIRTRPSCAVLSRSASRTSSSTLTGPTRTRSASLSLVLVCYFSLSHPSVAVVPPRAPRAEELRVAIASCAPTRWRGVTRARIAPSSRGVTIARHSRPTTHGSTAAVRPPPATIGLIAAARCGLRIPPSEFPAREVPRARVVPRDLQ